MIKCVGEKNETIEVIFSLWNRNKGDHYLLILTGAKTFLDEG
jgi:hypothetical protein